MSFRIETLNEMNEFAARLAAQLPLDAIVLLTGPMGVGKTQFVRNFVSARGSLETCSPSYAIHNQYATSRGLIDHFDLYRVESADDLESTGIWDSVFGSSTVILEWAERLRDFGLEGELPKGRTICKLQFALLPDGAREVRLTREK